MVTDLRQKCLRSPHGILINGLYLNMLLHSTISIFLFCCIGWVFSATDFSDWCRFYVLFYVLCKENPESLLHDYISFYRSLLNSMHFDGRRF